MDAALKVQISGLLFTLVLPAGAALAVLFAGRKWGSGERRPLFTGAAVLVGILVAIAGAGAPSIPPADADDWLFYGPLLAGVLGLGVDALVGRGGPWRVVSPAIGAIVLPLLGWQIAGRLAAVWQDGVAVPLASSAWLLDGLVIALVVWIALDRAADRSAEDDVCGAPLVLGPLAVALAGAALVTAMTGSARIGQLLGGSGAVVGLVGLIGWRWPVFAIGRGAVSAAFALVAGGLIFAHFFVDVPRPIAALVMLAPLGGAAGVAVAARLGRTVPGVLIALGISGALVGAAVGATAVNEEAKAAAVEAETEGGDDGTYYPY